MLELYNNLKKLWKTTRCVIITGTPKLLWYNFRINRYKLAIFIRNFFTEHQHILAVQYRGTGCKAVNVK